MGGRRAEDEEEWGMYVRGRDGSLHRWPSPVVKWSKNLYACVLELEK